MLVENKTRAPTRSYFPLTPQQQELWVAWELNPEAYNYNCYSCTTIEGDLDVVGFGQSLKIAVNYFDALRTRFARDADGLPQSYVSQKLDKTPCEYIDLWSSNSNQDPAVLKAKAREIIEEKTCLPFCLDKDILYVFCLVRYGENHYDYLFLAPHIISDARSAIVFSQALSVIYNQGEQLFKEQYSQGQGLGKYHDYLAGISTQEKERTRNHWLKKFRNAHLGMDFQRVGGCFEEAVYSFSWSEGLFKKMKAFCRQQKTTPFLFLSAVSACLQSRYFNQDKIWILYPENVRPKGGNKLFGYYVLPQFFKFNCQSHTQFSDVLKSARQQRREDSQYIPIPQSEAILMSAQRINGQSISTVSQTLFKETSLVLQGVKTDCYNVHPGAEEDDLALLFEASHKELLLKINYNQSLFEESFIEQYAQHLEAFVLSVMSDPAQQIAGINFMSEDESKKITGDYNKTDRSYPKDKTICQLFEEQAEKTPDSVALVFEGKTLSYGQLNKKANQLARYLGPLSPSTLIPLCLDRSFDMIISILGVLKAGGAYVPMDPKYPDERIRYVLEDTKGQVVLTQRYMSHRFDHAVCMDEEPYSHERTENPVGNNRSKDLAYVIYTSGTTGKPKGVAVNQTGIVNRIDWMQNEYPVQIGDRILQKTPYTFDVSVWELLWALWYGASIVIAKPNGHKDTDYLASLIEKQKITHLHFVPSMLAAFNHSLENTKGDLSSVRYLFCSGERLDQEVSDQTYSLFNSQSLSIHNLYGPTEASIDVSYFPCQPKQPVHIGKPIQNTRLYILDKRLNAVPVGVVGELYIGGAGLANGYLNKPELTEKAFIPNHFAKESDREKGYTRLYKTGDLVRLMPDGNIEYMGRNDFQVKIRGLRIELGEIEHALSTVATISQASVLVKNGQSGNPYLVAYYMSNLMLDSDKLIKHLSDQLPEYMVPQAFVQMKSFPFTMNGKLDTRALPEPDFQGSKEKYVAPRNKQEKKMADIWVELLGLKKVNVLDDFFRIGGDSMLSMRLTARMKAAGFNEISVKDIFDCRTIEKLSHKLSATVKPKEQALKNQVAEVFADCVDFDPFVSVGQEDNGQKPLFFFPTRQNGAEVYLGTLAPCLKNKSLVLFDNFVLHLISQSSGAISHYEAIESQAALYVQAVKLIQPEGPYQLFGWSYGGVLAFEVARQLEGAGDVVKRLGMADPYFNKEAISSDIDLTKMDFITKAMMNYLPSKNAWETNSQITLFKASMIEDLTSEAVALGMGPDVADWMNKQADHYVNHTSDNHLSAHVTCPNIEVVTMNSFHNDLLSHPEDLESIAQHLGASNSRSGE